MTNMNDEYICYICGFNGNWDFPDKVHGGDLGLRGMRSLFLLEVF